MAERYVSKTYHFSAFDDVQTPTTTATNKTFAWGQVGLGSFDDTGNFANLKLSGHRAKKQ